jgi:uncharacterized membrane protein (UPF0127 family)
MRNSPLRVGLAALCLVLSLCAWSCGSPMEKASISVAGKAFTVEVARTDAERQQGLMGRKSLGPTEGMLFVFDRDQRLDFWMKNTRVPLSIAFLSSEGKILELVDMQPLSEKIIRSRLSCRYALELPQGTFQAIGAGVGTAVMLP